MLPIDYNHIIIDVQRQLTKLLHSRQGITSQWSTGALRFAAELHRDGGKVTRGA